jgi:hypothetical protein
VSLFCFVEQLGPTNLSLIAGDPHLLQFKSLCVDIQILNERVSRTLLSQLLSIKLASFSTRTEVMFQVGFKKKSPSY